VVVRLRPAVNRPRGLGLDANTLRLQISPEILFALGLNVLDPEDQKSGKLVELVACRQQGTEEPSAYERVLGDAMKGDAALFAREDYSEEAWRIVDAALKAKTPVHAYKPGTWGPKAVARISPPGGWHNPDGGDESKMKACS